MQMVFVSTVIVKLVVNSITHLLLWIKKAVLIVKIKYLSQKINTQNLT